jgi:hypothetical protein
MAEPTGGQQRPKQDRGEPVPGGPHPLPGYQQPGIAGQARPPRPHRVAANATQQRISGLRTRMILQPRSHQCNPGCISVTLAAEVMGDGPS